jgi:azurin
MANRYKKITKADQKNLGGGYKNVVLWAPRDTFSLVAMPDPAVTTSGASLSVTDDHTFSTGNGFISWLCKQASVTLTAETTGDPGARSLVWSTTFSLMGDAASTQEQLEDMLNDDVIMLLKDSNCLAATDFVQLGDECNNPEVDVKFDGKTTAEGQKEYVVTVKVKRAKYFYSGTVTEKSCCDGRKNE